MLSAGKQRFIITRSGSAQTKEQSTGKDETDHKPLSQLLRWSTVTADLKIIEALTPKGRTHLLQVVTARQL